MAVRISSGTKQKRAEHITRRRFLTGAAGAAGLAVVPESREQTAAGK